MMGSYLWQQPQQSQHEDPMQKLQKYADLKQKRNNYRRRIPETQDVSTFENVMSG
jgi:hypothetical protein